MRIGIIAHWMNPNMVEMVRVLEERGATVEVIYPEKQLIDLRRIHLDHDLYLIKSGNDLALSLAGALHELGASTINPYPTVALLQDKIVTTRILQAEGVPTPDTYVTANREDLIPLLDTGPLVVKPYRGCRGEGISIVRNVRELGQLPMERTILAQRYQRSDDGRDYKIFCIGGRFFGVKRIFPLQTYADKIGEPFVVAPDLRAIAQHCGRAIGIDLFGVDVVISRGQPYVVDVNKFCSFIGVPNAPSLVADYVLTAGRRALQGESLLSTPTRSKAGSVKRPLPLARAQTMPVPLAHYEGTTS